MDPSAPNSNNPPANPPQNPVQPGQFVVAGEESNTAPAQPQPTVNLAQDHSSVTPQVFPNAPVSPAASQPDPTPFSPSPPVPGSVPPQTPAPPDEEPKSKSKLLLILVIILVLVGIIAAAAYFFVLPQLSKQKATSTDADQVTEEPSPPPRTDGGFGQLPESTASSEATGSGQSLPQDPLGNPVP